MIETIVEVEDGQYPFDEGCQQGTRVRVQEKQAFQNNEGLREKKNQLVKKSKLIDSGFIIKLIKIYQEDLTLYYVYEHVPFSLGNYIRTCLKKGSQEIVEMSSRLFFKKITNELTVLISYLISMRIEIDLSVDLLGLTPDEKVKIFMSPRCRMGHKTELTLIPFYNIRKEKILAFLKEELACFPSQNINQPKAQKTKITNLFSESSINQSIYQETINPQDLSNTSFTIDPSMVGTSSNQSAQSCLTQQPKPTFNSRRSSQNFGMPFRKKQHRQSVFSVGKDARSHKNSFQFGNIKADDNYSDRGDDKEDSRSYTHSRSIRIELQQNLNPSNKKNRKDSYKIKVTSFHQYEMDDCDPSELLGCMPKNEEDIAQFFSKQSPSKSTRTNLGQKYEEPKTPTMPPKKQNFMRKQSMPQGYRLSSATTARTLGEKVKLAKEKAENILRRYMKKGESRNDNLQ